MRKSFYSFIAIAALAMASTSFAKDQGNGNPTNSANGYGGDSYSGALAGAISASGALSSSGASSHSSNYNANDIDLSGAGSSAEKSYFLNLPQPVFTQIPASKDICVLNESSAAAIGWSFASGSGSKQVINKVCYLLRMAENAERTCQFASADMLNQVAFNEMFPSRVALPAANRQNQIACLK